MNTKFSTFEKACLVSIFWGIFTIAILQYASYYFLSPFPSADLVYIVNIPGIEEFPTYAFILPLLPASIGLITALIAMLKLDFMVRSIVTLVGIIISMLTSASFIPLSVPLVLAYLILIVGVGFPMFIRSMEFSGEQTLSLKDLSYNKKIHDGVLVTFQLAHDRWVAMIRETIGVSLTAGLIAASVIFVYLSTELPIFSGSWRSRAFFEMQTIFIGIILLYGAVNVFLGAFWFCHNKLLFIEEELQKYLKKATARTK